MKPSHHSVDTSDPVYHHARQESLWMLVVWAAFAVWVVGVSAWLGFKAPTQDGSVSMVLGFPSWVFWGIALPWLMANLVIISFAAWFIKEDPLEDPVTSQIAPPESSMTTDLRVDP